MTPYAVVFDLVLPHGRCVGLSLPPRSAVPDEAALARLHPDEREAAARLGEGRVGGWVGGRIALREALARLGRDAGAILSTARGAPALPEGLAGSVSHKEQLAVALVAEETSARLGVDLERTTPGKIDIARRVLRDEEQAELSSLPETARGRELLLRFSAKEAIYKALDPFVARYVGFHEARVTPRSDGSAAVELHLVGGEGDFSVEVRFTEVEGMHLTSAKITRR